jgi:hypothetical protein
MGRVGLLERRLGAQLENRCPHTEIHADAPQMAQNMLALIAVWEEGGE